MFNEQMLLTLQLDKEAIRVLYQSVDLQLKNWSGGDAVEQEQLMQMKIILYSALLEYTLLK